jgi:hypothetical protein
MAQRKKSLSLFINTLHDTVSIAAVVLMREIRLRLAYQETCRSILVVFTVSNRAGFSPSPLVSPANYHSTNVSYSSSKAGRDPSEVAVPRESCPTATTLMQPSYAKSYTSHPKLHNFCT